MVDDSKSFANEPQSISELRANKTSNGRDWTPRDVLIYLLREIDNGTIKPNACVVFMRLEVEHLDRPYTRYSVSSPGIEDTLGMIEAGKARILRDMIESGKS